MSEFDIICCHFCQNLTTWGATGLENLGFLIIKSHILAPSIQQPRLTSFGKISEYKTNGINITLGTIFSTINLRDLVSNINIKHYFPRGALAPQTP